MSQLIASFLARPAALLPGLYLGLLALVVLAFVVQVLRLYRQQQGLPATGADVSHRGGLPPGLAVTMGALFLLSFVPFVAGSGSRLAAWLRDPGGWFLGLFPLLGLGLMGYGLRAGRQARRRPASFVLDRVQLRPYGLVGGAFELRGAPVPGAQAQVHLLWQAVRRVVWFRRQRTLLQQPLWSTSQRVTVQQRGERARIPFLFRLPARWPEPEPGWRGEWLVVLEMAGRPRQVRVVQAERQPRRGAPLARPARAERPAALHPTAIHPTVQPVSPLANLAASAFVMVFPWLFWFAFDAHQQPWAHLATALPPVLAGGAVALCLFATPLLLLIRRVMGTRGDHPWQHLVRRGLPWVLAGDALLALGLAGLAVSGRLPPLDGQALSDGIVRAFLGMFLLVSLATPVLTWRDWARRRARRT